MASRKRRYLGCLGIIVALAVLLAIVNFALSLYYRHQSDLIARGMAKRGYPVTFDEMVTVQNAIPPDGRNGAMDVLEAFELFYDDGVDYGLVPKMGTYELPPAGTPISPEAMAAMKQMLDQNAGMLELMSRGVNAAVFRFPIASDVADDFMLFPIEWGKPTRNAVRLMQIRALYAGESGDMEAAIGRVREIVTFGGCLGTQPSTDGAIKNYTVIDMGFSVAVDLIQRGYVKTDDGFAQLEEIVSSAKMADQVYGLWTDTLNVEETWRTAIPGVMELAREFRADPPSIADLASFALDYVRINSFLRQRDNYLAREIIADPGNPLNDPEGTETLSFDPEHVFRSMSMVFIRAEYSVRARQCKTLLVIRAARFALERSRPPTMEEFMALSNDCKDPFNGQPMHYRPSENGFLIYSVGLNGRDDNGLTRRDLEGADDEVVEIRLPR